MDHSHPVDAYPGDRRWPGGRQGDIFTSSLTDVFDQLNLSVVMQRAKSRSGAAGWHCVLRTPDGWSRDLGVLVFYEEDGEHVRETEPTPSAVLSMLLEDDACDGGSCSSWILGDGAFLDSRRPPV